MENEQKEPYRVIADEIAESDDRDIILLNGPLLQPLDIEVINLCSTRKRRSNVLFILVTEGGNADASYRIARVLQEGYSNFSFFVTGYCKSAGTLLGLGANELIIGDFGELGPLDVQMIKEDELGATRSGLTVISALSTLHNAAFDAFEHFFLETKRRSGGSITTHTAIQVATSMAGTLFSPIYKHVDAMHVGEAGRYLKIAKKYGELLQEKSQNFTKQTLDELTNNYPTHSFVIDRFQAEKLFKNVRAPTENELKLSNLLGNAALVPCSSPKDTLLTFLNSKNELEDLHNEPETATHNDDSEVNRQIVDPRTDIPEISSDSTERP